MNPIENLFGNAQREMDAHNIRDPPKSQEETVRRFQQKCKANIQAGTAKKTFAAMPDRLRRVIEAKGGATKD